MFITYWLFRIIIMRLGKPILTYPCYRKKQIYVIEIKNVLKLIKKKILINYQKVPTNTF